MDAFIYLLGRAIRLYRRVIAFLSKHFVSGPLTALAGLAVAFCLGGPNTLTTAAYTELFDFAPRWSWGLAALLMACLGYHGLYFRCKSTWFVSHGFGVVLFSSLAWFFLLAGSITGTTTYLALASNSWVRFSDRYSEPFE